MSRYQTGDKRLEQIASQLKAGKKVQPVLVRDLVRSFGADYRGSHVNNLIRDALYQNNLRMDPNINQAGMNDPIEFHQGVVIDELEREYYENYRVPRPGQIMNKIEANFLFKLHVERVLDVASGWVDRNPNATKSEIEAKILALSELDFDTLAEEENSYIIPFPSRNTGTVQSEDTWLNETYEARKAVVLGEYYTAIGRFIVAFSQLERTLRSALGEALQLNTAQFHAVTSPYDFAGLCNVTRSIYGALPNCTDDERIKLREITNACLEINHDRNRIVHGTWFLDLEELGTEHVSRTSHKPTTYYKRIEDIYKVESEITKLMWRLNKFLPDLTK
jgi:hypothetical protein